MIPADFIKVPNIPLTTNGKVDTAQLHKFLERKRKEKTSYKAPENEAQRHLVAVCQEVLGLEKIGILDKFMALGGDSIRAIQLRIKLQQLGFELSIEDIYQQPNFQALAAKMQCNAHQTETFVEPFSLISEEIATQLPLSVTDAYPASKLQLGMLFHSTLNQDSHLYFEVDVVELKAPFDCDNWRFALQHMCRQHSVLRTSFELHQFQQPLQLVHEDIKPPMTATDLRELNSDSVKVYKNQLLISEKTKGFQLQSPG